VSARNYLSDFDQGIIVLLVDAKKQLIVLTTLSEEIYSKNYAKKNSSV